MTTNPNPDSPQPPGPGRPLSIDERVTRARDACDKATDQMVAALSARILATTTAVYPGATGITTYGAPTARAALTVEVTAVTRDSRPPIRARDLTGAALDQWHALAEDLRDDLRWLVATEGDENWVGPGTVPPPAALTNVHGSATFDFECADNDSGVTYRPWTDGWAVGYQARFDDGRLEYVYLNASGGSDDAVPNVFVYRGEQGDPGADEPQHFYDLDRPADEPEPPGHPGAGHWLSDSHARFLAAVLPTWIATVEGDEPDAARDEHLATLRAIEAALDTPIDHQSRPGG